ncbi:hypothetical protein AAHA92_32869 [Salvia divinorum]|uniref:DUF7642 domain-containing protein n=1 Tax=Salvia divinorum TaxID=28513 RepID=A0ABD1FM35_SALDI
MEDKDRLAETDRLERGLLLDRGPDSEQFDGDEDELPPLYTASFAEAEENFVKYQTARWLLYSLLLILAWGIGLFMLIYLPLRRYILLNDIRSRKLYLTANAIVYKVRRPVSFPCFGVLKKEKHVLLLSVADVVIEQGYLQSLFGVYSIRIENVGVRRPPSDDVQIQGITDPHAFREAVLSQLSITRGEVFSRKVSAPNDTPTPCTGHSSIDSVSPSKFRHDSLSLPRLGEVAILQKLEEVGSSVKRVQTLIEVQKLQASEIAESNLS